MDQKFHTCRTCFVVFAAPFECSLRTFCGIHDKDDTSKNAYVRVARRSSSCRPMLPIVGRASFGGAISCSFGRGGCRCHSGMCPLEDCWLHVDHFRPLFFFVLFPAPPPEAFGQHPSICTKPATHGPGASRKAQKLYSVRPQTILLLGLLV